MKSKNEAAEKLQAVIADEVIQRLNAFTEGKDNLSVPEIAFCYGRDAPTKRYSFLLCYGYSQ